VEEDVLLVVIIMVTFALAGGLSAVFLPRLLHKFKNITGSKRTKGNFLESHDTRKTELEGLNFEKNLVTQIINQVHRALENGDIDKLEGDRLLLKYTHDLESYNKKIAEMRPIVEFAEISQLRDGLISLIQERVATIDDRLGQLSKEITASSGTTSGWMKTKERNSAKKKIIEHHHSSALGSINSPTLVTERQKISEPAEDKEDPTRQNKVQEEKAVAQIQNQIMESLARLEQVSTDMPDISNYADKTDTVVGPESKINRSDVDKRKHDALANFDDSSV
jgi:hypothetical protein